MRRFIDLFIASVVLLLISPVLLIVALAIVIDSPGNPFYFARRVGRDGMPFRMWKFRTMVTGAAKLGPPITGSNDSRITRLGRLLRRTKIDELPQFINVFLGDMTLVGPRPEAPEMVDLYTPDQRRILAVKPGITGRVQLDSKEESDAIPAGVAADEYYVQHLMAHKVRADLDYLDKRTALTDCQVILATVLFVLRALFPRPASSNNYGTSRT